MSRQRLPSSPTGYSRIEERTTLISAPPPPPRGPGLEARVAVIEQRQVIIEQKQDAFAEQSERRHADVMERFARGESTSRHETTKIIVTAVVTVVTAVIGGKVIEKEPPPSQTVVHKSELSIKLESCEKIQDGVERARCISAVAASSSPAR